MKAIHLLIPAGIGIILSSCAGMPGVCARQQSAAIGATLGSAAGAIIGHQSGHGCEGAGIGGLLGTLLGVGFAARLDGYW